MIRTLNSNHQHELPSYKSQAYKAQQHTLVVDYGSYLIKRKPIKSTNIRAVTSRSSDGLHLNNPNVFTSDNVVRSGCFETKVALSPTRVMKLTEMKSSPNANSSVSTSASSLSTLSTTISMTSEGIDTFPSHLSSYIETPLCREHKKAEYICSRVRPFNHTVVVHMEYDDTEDDDTMLLHKGIPLRQRNYNKIEVYDPQLTRLPTSNHDLNNINELRRSRIRVDTARKIRPAAPRMQETLGNRRKTQLPQCRTETRRGRSPERTFHRPSIGISSAALPIHEPSTRPHRRTFSFKRKSLAHFHDPSPEHSKKNAETNDEISDIYTVVSLPTRDAQIQPPVLSEIPPLIITTANDKPKWNETLSTSCFVTASDKVNLTNCSVNMAQASGCENHFISKPTNTSHSPTVLTQKLDQYKSKKIYYSSCLTLTDMDDQNVFKNSNTIHFHKKTKEPHPWDDDYHSTCLHTKSDCKPLQDYSDDYSQSSLAKILDQSYDEQQQTQTNAVEKDQEPEKQKNTLSRRSSTNHKLTTTSLGEKDRNFDARTMQSYEIVGKPTAQRVLMNHLCDTILYDIPATLLEVGTSFHEICSKYSVENDDVQALKRRMEKLRSQAGCCSRGYEGSRND